MSGTWLRRTFGLGATITAQAELLEIDRNRLNFKVEAYEGERKIGEGTHRRAIINTGGQ